MGTMKLLVTGGAGFIGLNFIHYWVKEHPTDSIVNLDKLTYSGNLENLADLANNPNYQFIQGDIANPQAAEKAMEAVDLVVHFAAESHVDRSISDPGIFLKTNVLGTQVLLEAALKNKVKHFHHISTDEVYGDLDYDDPRKFNEESAYNPSSPYAASKASSDHLVRAYHRTYNLPITITNCSNNYGPYMFPEKFIPLSITNLLRDKPIPVYGEGKNRRDWLYITDHAKAIDLVIQKGVAGETYIVATGEEIPNLKVAKMIVELLGKSKDFIQFVTDRPGHDRHYPLDPSKIRTLGWQPEYTFEKGLKEMIQWYQTNRSWWEKLLKTP